VDVALVAPVVVPAWVVVALIAFGVAVLAAVQKARRGEPAAAWAV